MSKKEQKLKRIFIKHSTEYFIHNAKKQSVIVRKIFWISLPLFAWKQDYLSHSDKIKNYQKAQKNCNKAKALGMKKFEMALVVGTDPVLAYTCQVQNVPDTTDDWSLAGALRGQPVELVKCRTIDVEVPATAEFVFEWRLIFEN